jgi:hypothetical protein
LSIDRNQSRQTFVLAGARRTSYDVLMFSRSQRANGFRRFSARTALVAIAGLLFAQAALATYVCKNLVPTSVAAAPAPCHYSQENVGTDPAPAADALCHAHCFAPGATVDSGIALSAVLPTSALAIAPIARPMVPPPSWWAHAEPRANGPPLILLYARLLN